MKQKAVEDPNPLLSLLNKKVNAATQNHSKTKLSHDKFSNSQSPSIYDEQTLGSKAVLQSTMHKDQYDPFATELAPKPRTRSRDKSFTQTSHDSGFAAPLRTSGVSIKKSDDIGSILSPVRDSSHEFGSKTKTQSNEKADSQSIIDMLLGKDTQEPVPKPRKKETDFKDRPGSRSGSPPGGAKIRNR